MKIHDKSIILEISGIDIVTLNFDTAKDFLYNELVFDTECNFQSVSFILDPLDKYSEPYKTQLYEDWLLMLVEEYPLYLYFLNQELFKKSMSLLLKKRHSAFLFITGSLQLLHTNYEAPQKNLMLLYEEINQFVKRGKENENS